MLLKPKLYLMKDLFIQSKEIDIVYDKQSFSSVVTSHSSDYSPCKKNNCYCESRKKSSEEGFANGRWAQEEQLKFIEAMFIFGNEWKKVQKYIKTRSSTQSRSHSQKFFIRFRRKYIERYGEEELRSGISNSQTDHILEVLCELVHCNLICRLCKNSDAFFNGKNKENQEELKKIVSNFQFPPANLQGFIEEKKKNFFKVLLNLIQNSSQNQKESIEKDKELIENSLSLINYNNENNDNNINKIQFHSNTSSINSNSNNLLPSNCIDLNNEIDFHQNIERSNKGDVNSNLNINIKQDPFRLTFEEREEIAKTNIEEPHFIYFRNDDELNDNNYLTYFFTSDS